MHAPWFWIFLVAFILFFFIKGHVAGIKERAAKAARAQQLAAQDRANAEESAQRAADRASVRAARDARTARTLAAAQAIPAKPSFPSAAEQGVCEGCADPAHLSCPGDADCACCQHTLELVEAAQKSAD